MPNLRTDAAQSWCRCGVPFMFSAGAKGFPFLRHTVVYMNYYILLLYLRKSHAGKMMYDAR